jgi:hypothetical protein
MKMLLIVYNTSCEAEIRELLRDRQVRAFSQFPKLYGQGEAGVVDGSWICPGHNSGIFTVLPDADAEALAVEVKALVARTEGCGCVPIRAFLLPCEQVV